MNKENLAWTLILFISLLMHDVAVGDERILSFHSDISIAADATMTVDETIRVRAEGQNIRRGIYRDFPTDYTDQYGNRFVVGKSRICKPMKIFASSRRGSQKSKTIFSTLEGSITALCEC